MTNVINISLITLSLFGFVIGFYSQVQARKHISKEKISKLEDMSILASGPMPPKEILSETGLKYHKGFNIGATIFVVSIVLLMLNNHLAGAP